VTKRKIQLHFQGLIGMGMIFRLDDDIYTAFRDMFPDMNANHIVISDLKSELAKIKWREFISKFEKQIQDFNFGTLLRLNCLLPYTNENTILGTNEL
jgi:hypothetical protein